MREIKFRAWNQDNQKCAYFVFTENGHYTYTADLVAHSTNAIKEWQQFTGLKDKNGAEIYEGDVLAKLGRIYLNPWFGVLGSRGMSARDIRQLEAGACLIADEVIGNIYENPELLEKKS